ncbi:MAG: hypothetical protein JRH20_16480 [Deltaproteobacteria bacterium]|nr:hypothetical protein [Deltaproteobacteria bacterium]
MSACVDIAGGAIEVRWDLQYGGEGCTVPGEDEPRCVRGNRISCRLANISSLRLALTPLFGSGEDPCASNAGCRFACDDKVGTTSFFVPEGDYGISLHTLDPNGHLLGPSEGVTVPSPVVRQIRHGELTNLNVNLIIVETCLGC